MGVWICGCGCVGVDVDREGPLSGFYLGFFVLGRRSELKLMVGRGSVAKGRCFLGGLGACPPQKIFNILSLLRVILRHFKTVLRS